MWIFEKYAYLWSNHVVDVLEDLIQLSNARFQVQDFIVATRGVFERYPSGQA